MFKPLPENLSYPAIELAILELWDKNDVFSQSLKLREGQANFSFYEGPPTVNGKPGIHHMMARTIKDTICRYKTMNGYFVRRQAGWDTHGLPVEIAVEKELGLGNKSEIEKFGIDNFNKKCREFVYKNIEMDLGWRTLTRRMGYWLNLDEAYITCTNNYVESVWWALKTYFDKGLIYKGFKVIPQSPTIETPLSSHELSLGYKDVRDPNCYLKLKITGSKFDELKEACLMVWTTTPWTLLANVALAVGLDIDYVLVQNKRKVKEEELSDKLVLAQSRLAVLDGDYEILKTYKGAELIGTGYEQIFPYCVIDKEKYPQALTVLPGEFVSTEDGSGIVHLAPAFGEDDYSMSKKFKIPFLQPVTPNGHFTADMGEFAGRAIKTFTYSDHVEDGSDKDIIIALKYAGKIYRATMDYLHSYPHCWRTGNPIMYYARESWFIKSPEFKDDMIALNKIINWQPPEIGEGRFGNWLEEVKEWSLSRDRFWGTPIPIWVSEDGKDMFAIGSIEELKAGYFYDELNSESGVQVLENDIDASNSQNPIPETQYPKLGKKVFLKDLNIEIDLHRPFVDKILFERDGKIFRRIHEVADAWFDSGSMPFAQFHYPFENVELFNKSFPGDFIAEGIDQTRGWFYTLHNIAVALFKKPAYKNIVVNELILDKEGVKMSKSKGNVVDPFEIMDKYGADAVRWYLFVNNPPWKATLFNPEDIEKTILSDFFRSLTNSYAFFALYANIDEINCNEPAIAYIERPEIDRWILSRVNTLIDEYKKYMDDYELTRAHRAVQNFVINELSNWYIRRNRRRFWKGEKDNDKIAAYQTLREVLLHILALMAPAAPFLSEDLYQRLRADNDEISIHLKDFPEVNHELIDAGLEEKMGLAQIIVTLARSLREKAKIRVRQPLHRLLIPVLSTKQRRDIQYFEDIIKEELNVKNIEYVTDESGIVSKKAKPDFKVIGKKYGKMTQHVSNAIKLLSNSQVKELELKKSLELDINNDKVVISMEDVEIVSDNIEGWLVAIDENVTVALDTVLDDTLISEGLARELVSRLQKIRKDSGLEVTDRISVRINADDKFIKTLLLMKDYISSEILAEELFVDNTITGDIIEIDDYKINVIIEKK